MMLATGVCSHPGGKSLISFYWGLGMSPNCLCSPSSCVTCRQDVCCTIILCVPCSTTSLASRPEGDAPVLDRMPRWVGGPGGWVAWVAQVGGPGGWVAWVGGWPGWPRWVAQVGGLGGWPRWVGGLGGPGGWPRWVAQVGGWPGWPRWVARVGGPGGWVAWVAQVGGPGGWPRWVAQVGGPGGWVAWVGGPGGWPGWVELLLCTSTSCVTPSAHTVPLGDFP